MAADVSPAYLYYPQASQRIARWAPQAHIVMILRNPVECVLSMYSMMRRDGREPCHSLVEAFERSQQRIAAGWEWAWDYKNGYKFAKQVERYTKRYPPSQLFIRRYEQLQREPERFYRELTEFLGISAIDVTDSNQRVNTAPRRVDILRQTRGGRVLHRAGRILGRVLPPRFATAIPRRFDAPAFTLKRAERRFLVDHFGRHRRAFAQAVVGSGRLAARVAHSRFAPRTVCQPRSLAGQTDRHRQLVLDLDDMLSQDQAVGRSSQGFEPVENRLHTAPADSEQMRHRVTFWRGHEPTRRDVDCSTNQTSDYRAKKPLTFAPIRCEFVWP